MIFKHPIVWTLAATACLYAQVPTTVRVSSETVPPGGMAQVKVLMTSPQPITGGGVKFDGALDVADGISLFSSTGDVFGTAVQTGGSLDVRFVSPNGTFGTETDYPILTITFPVSADAIPGTASTVTLGSSTVWESLLTSAVPVELKPGTLTVGGSVSISNVLPGGGRLPAGSKVRVLGIGFSPKTKLQIKNMKVDTITYVSPTEFQLVLKTSTTLDGVSIQAKNPDGSSSTYFSYMRGVPVGVSANPLVARTVPVFSTNTVTSAMLPPMILPQINSPYVVGLALQNPGQVAADIRLQLHSASGPQLGDVSLTLNPGERISRDLPEWFGGPIPSGAYLQLKASSPVQVLGLFGNTTDGTVRPLALVRN